VTDHIDLGHFRHIREIIVPSKLSGDDRIDIRFLDIELRQAITDPARLRTFEDQRLVLCGMRCNFLD